MTNHSHEHIVYLNVGGQKFVTSRQTLTWIPDSFFTSLLGGRITSIKDADGAIFLDRDPQLFAVILNYLRTKEIDLSVCNINSIKHEAQYYALGPLVKRLTLCEEMNQCPCGDVLFHGYLSPPPLPLPDVPSASGGKGKASASIASQSSASTASSSTHARNLSEPPNLPSRSNTRMLPSMDSKFQVPAVVEEATGSTGSVVASGASSSNFTVGGKPVIEKRQKSPAPPPPVDSGNITKVNVPGHTRASSADHMKINVPGSMSPPRPLGYYGHTKKGSGDLTRQFKAELAGMLRQQQHAHRHVPDPYKVRMMRAHHNWLAVAYENFVCCYRMKDSLGWQCIYVSGRLESPVNYIAFNSKHGTQGSDKMMAVALQDKTIRLFTVSDQNHEHSIGVFTLGVLVDKMFFIGSTLVALSKTGKIGIWHAMTQAWQVQEVVPISSYDMAGSFLLLGCTNGSIYYIDMQKFPLRMKDNDLLVTELYRDPSSDTITSISVYLTPKTNLCGNWIEIAYGTSSGSVRIIVQHPETVGHCPQLFQTFTVHRAPVTRVSLTTTHLISVCSEYNHVRSWSVTRFRGMINTQPGSTPLASFKVLTLESDDADAASQGHSINSEYGNADVGPFGDQDGEQLFIQRVVPDTNQLFVRLASNGERVCVIKSVDESVINSFLVHECEGSTRIGSRPRRYLFTGHSTGAIQMWDLTTALDLHRSGHSVGSQLIPLTTNKQSASANQNTPNTNQPANNQPSTSQPPTVALTINTNHLQGPTPHELLRLIDECEICSTSLNSTPCSTPISSTVHLPSLFHNHKSPHY